MKRRYLKNSILTTRWKKIRHEIGFSEMKWKINVKFRSNLYVYVPSK